MSTLIAADNCGESENTKGAWHRQETMISPYELDSVQCNTNVLLDKTIFLDGVLKGDYSLAIVNRFLAQALLQMGLNLTLFTSELGWQEDAMLANMPMVKARCIEAFPPRGKFDIHLRNNWPPVADDMVGRINAYVCFAWEEMEFTQRWVEHFNSHLDFVMVTSNFVEQSFRHSGVIIPIFVVGNGCDHVAMTSIHPYNSPVLQTEKRRFIHVSSCFPRKGADILLAAFTDTFRSREDVELVIKTSHNEHNTIIRDVAQTLARVPDPPSIRVVTASYDFPQLLALVQTASALVAPTRGEGFGLPMAEAMRLGVPVITTGYSGQTDFCTPDTAWLIDYEQVQSAAHVGGQYSLWAEPSHASLCNQMRRILVEPDEVRRRCHNAKRLLQKYAKWRDVAQRVAKSVVLFEQRGRWAARDRDDDVRTIDMVSTWGQICGVATYAEFLCCSESLRPLIKNVFGRKILGDARSYSSIATLDDVVVERPWGYDSVGIDSLARRLEIGDADVIWIQHHPGFFSCPDMTKLEAALRSSRYNLRVATLHNVKEVVASENHGWIGGFDAIFVHTARDAEELSKIGHNNVAVLPHGIVPKKPPAPRESAAGFTVGTFGFLYPHKGVTKLIEATARIRQIIPNFRLKIMTCERKDDVSRLTRARVETLISMLNLRDVITTCFNFLEQDELLAGLQHCDLLCFPYSDSTESASGALRIALSADMPIICSDSAVLSDVQAFSHVLANTKPETIAEAVIVLAAHPNLRNLHNEERREFVRLHSYDRVARRFLNDLNYMFRNKGQGRYRAISQTA